MGGGARRAPWPVSDHLHFSNSSAPAGQLHYFEGVISSLGLRLLFQNANDNPFPPKKKKKRKERKEKKKISQPGQRHFVRLQYYYVPGITCDCAFDPHNHFGGQIIIPIFQVRKLRLIEQTLSLAQAFSAV